MQYQGTLSAEQFYVFSIYKDQIHDNHTLSSRHGTYINIRHHGPSNRYFITTDIPTAPLIAFLIRLKAIK